MSKKSKFFSRFGIAANAEPWEPENTPSRQLRHKGRLWVNPMVPIRKIFVAVDFDCDDFLRYIFHGLLLSRGLRNIKIYIFCIWQYVVRKRCKINQW